MGGEIDKVTAPGDLRTHAPWEGAPISLGRAYRALQDNRNTDDFTNFAVLDSAPHRQKAWVGATIIGDDDGRLGRTEFVDHRLPLGDGARHWLLDLARLA